MIDNERVEKVIDWPESPQTYNQARIASLPKTTPEPEVVQPNLPLHQQPEASDHSVATSHHRVPLGCHRQNY